jgi:hypothetical protein
MFGFVWGTVNVKKDVVGNKSENLEKKTSEFDLNPAHLNKMKDTSSKRKH